MALAPRLRHNSRVKREDDSWVRPEEDYVQVARLTRNAQGRPVLLEVRASHLKDYMCARGMALFVSSYRDRTEVVEDGSAIQWQDGRAEEKDAQDRWQGIVYDIHEGGEEYGAEWAFFHMARTDIDYGEDVPVMGPPTKSGTSSKSWTSKQTGKKLQVVRGELWRQEWVEPAAVSPLVRRDEVDSTVHFIVDAEGRRESSRTLKETGFSDSGRWLWFRPDVVNALADRRGGSLQWYTRDTGKVSCSPGYDVHFGVNALGLVTVYAEDVARLPEWQQRIWAGHNIGPEGKVSEELLASQVAAKPARTAAPEAYLSRALEALRVAASDNLGIQILRVHEEADDLLRRVHRFRAVDRRGLFALAKDVAKLTAELIDAKELQKIVQPPKDVKWGSLKSLEKVLATKVGEENAQHLVRPLFGVYELRLADAHLQSDEISNSLRLIEIDEAVPPIVQGWQLLSSVVSTLYRIAAVLDSK